MCCAQALRARTLPCCSADATLRGGGWLRRPNIAVARLEVTEGRVVLVNSDRAVSTHRWLSPKDAGLSSNWLSATSHAYKSIWAA